ncbi:MAG: hypothetical protein ACP5O0_11405, partial [Acidimicrobiales bacterium]
VALSDMDELVRIERGAPEAVFGGNYGLKTPHQRSAQRSTGERTHSTSSATSKQISRRNLPTLQLIAKHSYRAGTERK